MLGNLLIGAVVGSLICRYRLMLVATFPGPTPVANTSITAAQIPVSSTSIAVSAARFTPIPVSNTFIPVTQRGGRGGRRIASNIAKLPMLLGKP